MLGNRDKKLVLIPKECYCPSMSPLEIIALIVFPVTLSSFQLTVQQERTLRSDRMPMFRSELFTSIVMFPSFVLAVASGIVLLLHSWQILVITFIATALVYPIFGRFLISRLWAVPYYFLDKWARKKESGE